MNRRNLLIVAGGSLVTTVAGCTSDESNGTPEGDGGTSTQTDDDENGENGGIASIRNTADLFDSEYMSFSGNGEFTSDEFNLEMGFTVVTFDHSGEDAYTIDLVDEDGHNILINGGGSIDAAIGFPVTAGTYQLHTNNWGEWSAKIAQPSPSPDAIQDLPAEITGTGWDVIGPVELNGTVEFEASTTSNDGVTVFPGGAGSIGTQITDTLEGEQITLGEDESPESATVDIHSDTAPWLVIHSKDDWEITIE